MLYSEKYPNAKPSQEVEPGVFVARVAGRCFCCKTKTVFHDLDFQAYFCSEICLKKIWDEFVKDSKKSSEPI